MTSSERQFDSSEHHTPKWQMLDPFIRKRIGSTDASIESTGERDTQRQLHTLHNNFISEGLIGLLSKVKSEYALFVCTQITEEGVGEVPVYDIDLRSQNEFIGVFKGCVADRIELDTSMNLLFYNIELNVEGYDQLFVRVPVNEGSIMVEYDDSDNWDKEVDGAFAVLETVDDDAYKAIVEGLRDAYWNTDQIMKLRLRTIGIYATELLSHPLHVESSETTEALNTILLCSVDEEAVYKVAGLTLDETRERGGAPLVNVTNRRKPRALKPVGVRYVTNFELKNHDGEEVDITLTNALQPALTFFDVKERVELDYPFRFLADIEAFDYDEDSLLDVHSVNPVTTNYYGAIGQKTCGELSHEYNKHNK